MGQDRTGFESLVELVALLRDPEEGCPWDLEQTHQSLSKYLEEETNETLEVLDGFSGNDGGDFEALKDELGDVLLQVLLHSQLAQESGRFNIDDVLTNLSNKLIRRHPHVFGDSKASTIEEVTEQWERIKSDEKQS